MCNAVPMYCSNIGFCFDICVNSFFFLKKPHPFLFPYPQMAAGPCSTQLSSQAWTLQSLTHGHKS